MVLPVHRSVCVEQLRKKLSFSALIRIFLEMSPWRVKGFWFWGFNFTVEGLRTLLWEYWVCLSKAANPPVWFRETIWWLNQSPVPLYYPPPPPPGTPHPLRSWSSQAGGALGLPICPAENWQVPPILLVSAYLANERQPGARATYAAKAVSCSFSCTKQCLGTLSAGYQACT